MGWGREWSSWQYVSLAPSRATQRETSAGLPGLSGRTGETFALNRSKVKVRGYWSKLKEAPKSGFKPRVPTANRRPHPWAGSPENAGSRKAPRPLELRVAGSVTCPKAQNGVCQEGVGRVVPPEATFFPLQESRLPASPVQDSVSCQPHPSHPPHSPAQLACPPLPTKLWPLLALPSVSPLWAGACHNLVTSFPFPLKGTTTRPLTSGHGWVKESSWRR